MSMIDVIIIGLRPDSIWSVSMSWGTYGLTMLVVILPTSYAGNGSGAYVGGAALGDIPLDMPLRFMA